MKNQDNHTVAVDLVVVAGVAIGTIDLHTRKRCAFLLEMRFTVGSKVSKYIKYAFCVPRIGGSPENFTFIIYFLSSYL
jgi:hypothetical protein